MNFCGKTLRLFDSSYKTVLRTYKRIFYSSTNKGVMSFCRNVENMELLAITQKQKTVGLSGFQHPVYHKKRLRDYLVRFFLTLMVFKLNTYKLPKFTKTCTTNFSMLFFLNIYIFCAVIFVTRFFEETNIKLRF